MTEEFKGVKWGQGDNKLVLVTSSHHLITLEVIFMEHSPEHYATFSKNEAISLGGL